MIGAIIGDIAGSRFEFNNHRSKEFELLHENCSVTDDSIMSLAVCDAILKSDGDYSSLGAITVKSMQRIGRHYPDCGYGSSFYRWIFAKNPKPYNSFGNGAAMRISACGYAAESLEDAEKLSRAVTEISHNHPEGLKGAEAVAVAIYLARYGKYRKEIREFIEDRYYRIDFTLDDIRESYAFNETCQDTVPQAFEAFFEANDFEDAIRNAISIGGDSDTLAAITGSLAEAFFGVPEHIRAKAQTYLNKELSDILGRFEAKFGAPAPVFLPDSTFDTADSFNGFIPGMTAALQASRREQRETTEVEAKIKARDGLTPEELKSIREDLKPLFALIEPFDRARNSPPHKSLGPGNCEIDDLEPALHNTYLKAYYDFAHRHPKLVQDYLNHCSTMHRHAKRLMELDASKFSLKDAVCAITFCTRAEHHCDGSIYNSVKQGFMQAALRRLKTICDKMPAK
ncbi:MAG: ADP-ribosylglycohydrolase family protein [Succinivibrio sp.]|nr:ADP-ribosylglycohydrolase family protein [Succinivibrio sp.]